jgi:hypothetical protein
MTESITDKIVNELAAIAPDIDELIIETIKKSEIQRCADIFIEGHSLWKRRAREAENFEANHTFYNLDGSLAQSYVTKDKLDQQSKLTENIAKLDKAMNSCRKGDTKALSEIIAKANQKPDAKPKAEAE